MKKDSREGIKQMLQDLAGINTAGLEETELDGFIKIAYSKFPFGDPTEVIEYLYGLNGRKKLTENEIVNITGIQQKEIDWVKNYLRLQFCEENMLNNYAKYITLSKWGLIVALFEEKSRQAKRTYNEDWMQKQRDDWRDVASFLIRNSAFLNMSILDLELSKRITNSLSRGGINTVNDLVLRGRDTMLIFGIGVRQQEEIRLKLFEKTKPYYIFPLFWK